MPSAIRLGVVVGIFVLALAASTTQAADRPKPKPAEVVKQGKAATVMVDRGPYGTATAFCIDKDGYFITNHHVIKTIKTVVDTKLILNSGEKDQKVVIAEVVRSDPKLDLALLKVKDAKGLIALELGSDDDLIETTPVTAFGFPLGEWLSLEAKTYPNITVSTGKITALRKEKGELGAIQIDAQVNPGNSGGPVVDESGKVLGVIVAGVVGTGLNFAIPVSQLRRFINQPSVTVTAPVVLFKDRRLPAKFEIEVFASAGAPKPAKPLTVELTLPGETTDKPRVQEVKLAGEKVTLSAAPLPPRAGPEKLRVQCGVGRNALVGDMVDHEFKVGERMFRLIDVEKMSRDNSNAELYEITLRGGKKWTGKITGLREVIDAKGEKQILKNPTYINVFGLDMEPREVTYQVKIKSGSEVLHAVTDKILIQQLPETPPRNLVPNVPVVKQEVKPGSLKIISATYGLPGRVSVDVTKAVTAAIKDDRILIPVEVPALGLTEDPAFGKHKTVTVKFQYDAEVRTVQATDGGMLAIAAPVKVTKDEGLTIIEARYGTGAQWLDIAASLRKLIKDPKDPELRFKIDPNVISESKDPVPGTKKTAVVVYAWKGRQYVRTAQDGAGMSINPTRDYPDD